MELPLVRAAAFDPATSALRFGTCKTGVAAVSKFARELDRRCDMDGDGSAESDSQPNDGDDPDGRDAPSVSVEVDPDGEMPAASGADVATAVGSTGEPAADTPPLSTAAVPTTPDEPPLVTAAATKGLPAESEAAIVTVAGLVASPPITRLP
jgi:hypothetical protein